METVGHIDAGIFKHCKLVKMSRTEFSQAGSTGAATLKKGKNKFRGHTLDKSIHLYRMWFFLVKVAYDCEQAKHKFGVMDQHSVKLNKKFYKEWDIENYIDKSFDEFFADKIHLFGEERVSLVDEIEDSEEHIFLKIRKKSRVEDVVRDVRELLKDMKYKSDVKFQIKRQHKYFYLHQQYNVFLMRQSGWKGREVLSWCQKNYGNYKTRLANSEQALRKVFRASEQIVIDVAQGHF